jgi:large repetitive protein
MFAVTRLWLSAALFAVGVSMSLSAQADPVSIKVVNSAGGAFNGGFRYVIEEDRTFDVVPGVTGLNNTPTLAFDFHKSYMPVVTSGQSNGDQATVNLPAGKRYFVSVMPNNPGFANAVASSYTMGSAPIRAQANGSLQSQVSVIVHPLPVRTAQISIFVHEDSNPINNQPDAPGSVERGLCGFEIQLFEAGGTFGASGGRVLFDTFGNPLGTSYLADGSVDKLGNGVVFTDTSGVLRIKNLAPAKYTLYAVPPAAMPSEAQCPGVYKAAANNANDNRIAWNIAGEFSHANDPQRQKWFQTATIEGTVGIDAWVKSNEPTYFKEFGPPGHHVFIGFVRRFKDPALTGNAGVSGRITNVHMSRPPGIRFHSGKTVESCYVGINEVAAGAGAGRGLYADACAPDGSFNVTGLEAGRRYQLAVWDKALDNVFALYDFITPAAGGSVDLHDVPVFNWFAKLQGTVFHDEAQDGVKTADKPGIPGQAVNLRFRDGSIYQSVLTDDNGRYEFGEVFPFFNWLVAEVDFLRFKATGATIVVDNGGKLDPAVVDGVDWSEGRSLSPQAQASNGDKPYRIETGPVLTQGFQAFLGQTNAIHWGKTTYARGENGGISGIVHYASTRAEWDPKYATAENNEPGVPGVEVRLYRAGANGRPVKPDGSAIVGVPSAQDALQIVFTDSWDNSNPSGCVDPNPYRRPGSATPLDCYDGMRIWNQVRPAVFDGGYAFNNLTPGQYVVEAVAPTAYEHQKEEDKNVDFGDLLAGGTLADPVNCVGLRSEDPSIPALVPQFLTLFPGVEIPEQYRGNRPYCNRKLVTLGEGMNAAADFNIFTKVPVSGHIVGMILDDLANEFDPYSPSFGEKYAPPFMPVSIRDFTGREINRVYSDRFGTYNALVPSTFSYNIPLPSGVSPSMITVCLNSPTMQVPDATVPNGYRTVLDPHHNRQYSQFCYNFQYLPGKTTYLDTPVLPIAAFAGPSQYPLSCESPAATPSIRMVTGGPGNEMRGPVVPLLGNRLIKIYSEGTVQIQNPEYDQDQSTPDAQAVPRMITRDFGFGVLGPKSAITVGGQAINLSAPSNQVNWTNDVISVRVPVGLSGDILVTRDNGAQSAKQTVRGVTLHQPNAALVLLGSGNEQRVGPTRTYKTIQAAVDAASTKDGTLILVDPGLYEENVILHKRVRLQGWGAPSVIINAAANPAESTHAWRVKACNLVLQHPDSLIGGQVLPANLNACVTGDTADNAPALFATEESAGVFALLRPAAATGALGLLSRAQVDGLTITGSDGGGAIVLNGNANRTIISNNLIMGNQGAYGGGVRLGHPAQTVEGVYTDAMNYDVSIRYNDIRQNGNLAGQTNGGGGGISLYPGSNRYIVERNQVCGNFSTGDGGGLAHYGLSPDGSIQNNQFTFNQSFSQSKGVQGGGLSITGQASLNPADNGLSLGTGSVVVRNNLFQGNLAGAGDGGAMSVVGVNGSDVRQANGSPTPLANWNRVDIFNNVIVDNVAGLAGGGIALYDSPNTRIINNTIAHNDSTATAGAAFPLTAAPTALGIQSGTGLSSSSPQPGAGIVARGNSAALVAAIDAGAAADKKYFSNAELQNNIVWRNRQFRWAIDYTQPEDTHYACNYGNSGAASGTTTCFEMLPNLAKGQAPMYSDLGVIGLPAQAPVGSALQISNSILTDASGVPGANVTGDPRFLRAYFNGDRSSVKTLVLTPEASTTIATAAAFDEGGNFIDVRFGPLTTVIPSGPEAGLPFGDYRVAPSSAGAAIGANRSDIPSLRTDYLGRTTNALQNGRPPRPALASNPVPPWTAGAFIPE